MSVWLALACWAATAGEASADSLPNRLPLRIAAPPAVVAAVAARLAPRLATLGVALDLAPVPEVNVERILELPPDNAADAPLARGWVNAQDLDQAVVLLVPRRADRVLMRTVPLTLGLDEAGLAQVTFIIERSVASLLASEPIGVPHAEARAALDAAARPGVVPAAGGPAEEQQTALQLGVFAGAASWSSAPLLTPRLGLDFWIDWITGEMRMGLAASVAAEPSFHRTDANGDVLMRAVAVHAWLTAGQSLGGLGVGRVAVGPAVLVTHVAPSLAGAFPSVMQEARTDVDPVLALMVRWDYPLGRGASAFLAATADVVLRRASYVVKVDGDNRELFSPWPLRPGLVLGISVGSERPHR